MSDVEAMMRAVPRGRPRSCPDQSVGGDDLQLHDAALRIALRASNLAEQHAIMGALGGGATWSNGDRLTDAEEWKLRQTCERLAPDDTGPLERVLRDFLLLRQRVGDLGSAERTVVTETHRSWLGTYVKAVDGDWSDGGPAVDSNVRCRLALVCRPFTQVIKDHLEHIRGATNHLASRDLVSSDIVDAFSEHLVDRFELSIAWALEAHQNLVLARSGISRDEATDDDYEQYFRLAFADSSAFHNFFLRFPVLGRWLATVTDQLCAGGARLIERLGTDADRIGTELFDERILSYSGIEMGKSDYHEGGASVAFVDVALASGRAGFVYKPRALGPEIAMQGLLRQLRTDGVATLATRGVLEMDGYGYEELIPALRNDVGSIEEVEQVYEDLGALLAIFYLLGGSDLHHENVIVADGHAYVCDCETVLGVELEGYERGRHTVADSVYRTGLLEWPAPTTIEAVTRVSGYAGGGSYESPFPLPRIQGGSVPVVRHESGVRIDDTTANRVHLDGELVEPQDHEESILRGFCRVHDWFCHEPTAQSLLGDLFARADIRYVARDTQTYTQLLLAARHPRCLVDPLEVDIVFEYLDEAPLPWDPAGTVKELEIQSLWRLDVPIFSLSARGRALLHDHGTVTGVEAARPPIEYALDRLRSIPGDDQSRQASYVRASLSTAQVHSASFAEAALDWARLVGREVARVLDDAKGPRWTYADEDDGVAGTLYYGSAGAALFLAYLDDVAPKPAIRQAAERALDHVRAHRPNGIGAYDGLAGTVYLLTHLHALWGDPALLDEALDIVAQIDASVGDDAMLDVLSGSAGVIAVMLGLPDRAAGRSTAERCARHLLDRAVRSEYGLSWPASDPNVASADLTGLAHGAGGIGWALAAIGGILGNDAYVDAAYQAFAYERHHFDHGRRDWYDLRTSVKPPSGERPFGNAWCNGAPGIGLTRIATWDALDDPEQSLLDETYIALAATLRGLVSVGNDTLCHGRSGNSELLLRIATVDDAPAFQVEANVQAQAMWRRLAGEPNWPREESGQQPLTGLMAGIAGVGLHCLRLAAPDRVPSPLLLDPPPRRLRTEGSS